MIKDYRFKDIEKYLKKDSTIGKDILDAFSSLSDAAIIFSPIILGPQFLPLIELLDVKDRLFDLGHKVYDFIAQRTELDYVDRIEQIKAAYALICYTAYFDVLQDALPSAIRKKLKLKFEEKKKIIENSIDTNDTYLVSSATPEIHCNVYYADHVTTFSEIKEQLLVFYNRVTQNIIKLVADSAAFDMSKEKEKHDFEQLKTSLEKLPLKALNIYEAQYISLADQFNDFALFAQLKNFEGIRNAINRNGQAISLLTDIANAIDVGLCNLKNIVNSISTTYSIIQAQDIVNDLRKKYIAAIEEPIIDDKEIKADTETLSLKFPRIVDAFIPQSYKCFSYQRKDIRLEENAIWKSLSIQHDLDKFFIKYLYSPDSTDYPLIILGQPGSGKSLLTKVLSAQLMSNSYTVIRIPLREVNAEDGIDVLVEDQIKKITNRPLSTQGYGGFATQFNEKPLIIILDGYDELLQAKGDIFSGYLEKVRMFQQDQKSLNRPVRMIVTSRITLIDKARIPENSTILRLMEFDTQQRQTWINIWNSINADYFASMNINPFSLPLKEKGKKNSIIELAEQPLLLLMLALYDSEANELATTSNIKRTELYDNLLRRFVRRERRRYVPGFNEKEPNEQEAIIDQEMNRLGVVAIGMYNRRDVVILSRQLEEDLETFHARRQDGSPKAKTLKESESVLGGFFFIHKSTAQDIDAHSSSSDSAYEFLHNTFGEFLTADFILRNMINEVKDIIVDRKFKRSGLDNKLTDPDLLNSGWYYCLMFVPLYSRPVVIEMLREHALAALQRALKLYNIPITISHNDLVDNLKFLVKNQLKMILNTRNIPKVMRKGVILDQDMPLLGYLSTYSLNLVILSCILSSIGFEFDEQEYAQSIPSFQDAKPWDKLISLWKAWFSSADLTGLSAILKAKRISENKILIECNDKFESTRYEQPIDILLCVSSTLADNLLVGLAGLQTPRFCEITRMSIKRICALLKIESPDLYFAYLICLLKQEIHEQFGNRKDIEANTSHYDRINEIIEAIMHDDKINLINSNTWINICEMVEYCLMCKLVYISTRKHLVETLSHILLGDSKTGIKKLIRKPGIDSGIRVLRLLINNTGFLIHTGPSGTFPKRALYDDEWSSEINRLMRYTFEYSKGEFLLYHITFEKNINELSFVDAVKNLFALRDSDKKQLFDHLFSPGNMKILLMTNPEMLSTILLAVSKSSAFETLETDRITEFYLNETLTLIEDVGIGYFDFNTIINTIAIARKAKAIWFINGITEKLQYLLYRGPSGYFDYLLFYYPNFIAEIIDLIPELLNHMLPDHFGEYVFSRDNQLADFETFLDYIKVFRRINNLMNSNELDDRNSLKMLHWLNRRIILPKDLKQVDFLKLSTNQIMDLKWYAQVTDNGLLLKKIQSILQQLTF